MKKPLTDFFFTSGRANLPKEDEGGRNYFTHGIRETQLKNVLCVHEYLYLKQKTPTEELQWPNRAQTGLSRIITYW